ncbi:hypothetical protein GCM10023323_18730 [Streptomyces thinghirensis]|uniref:Uncharacterized protein n=1 Tax=Streptomyces thinghirensis TaxID=551547 RepID=A0ABP9SYG6_9ACTN
MAGILCHDRWGRGPGGGAAAELPVGPPSLCPFGHLPLPRGLLTPPERGVTFGFVSIRSRRAPR